MTERYEILEKIAEGGLGSVYRAWDKNLGREVAIKRVRGDAGDGEAEALVREARTASVLQHPNIVTVYDVGIDDEGPFIVMEYVKGETLEETIQRGALTGHDFDLLVTQALEGLIAAHAHGLVHLDLKPGNLMVSWLASGRFQVKVLDFGLARVVHQPGSQESDGEGAVMGSIFFMAPEQFERSAVDARTDLYSLGAIFYYALTQQYPFQGETNPEVMVAHLHHRVTPLGELRPDLPAFYHRWVEWLFSRRPEDRPASAVEAMECFRSRQLGGSLEAMAVPVAEAADDAPPKLKKTPVTGRLGDAGRLQATPAPSKAAAGPLARAGAPAAPPRPARPSHPQPRATGGGLPKWAWVTIPLLVVLITGFGFVRYIESSRRAERESRLAELAQSDEPEVSDADVKLLFSFLESPSSSPAAAQALSRAIGGDYINTMLVDHLDHASSRVARVNLVKVLGMRGVQTAFKPIFRLTQDKDGEVRKAAWTATGMLASAADLPELMDRLSSVDQAERDFAEQALITAVQAEQNHGERVAAVLNVWRSGLGSEAQRAMILHVLGHTGGAPQALEAVEGALGHPSVEIRKAALSALSLWPSSEPLTALAAHLGQEKDPACRLLLLVAATASISQPGSQPQEERAALAQRLYQGARDQREKDQALAALSRCVAPSAVTFFDGLGVTEPARKREAEAISKRIRGALDSAIAIGAEATELRPEKAEFSHVGGLSVSGGWLVNWLSEADWATWWVKVDAAGAYDVRVQAASTASGAGRFAIGLAGSRLEADVVHTRSGTDFATIAVGRVEVKKPGLYQLRLEPVKLPPDEPLFRLKSVILSQ